MITPRARAARYVAGVSAAIVVWLFAISGAHADAIAAHPLWDLVEESQLVVIAVVEGRRDVPLEEARLLSTRVAVLKVLETLKGEGAPSLEVRYAPEVRCPAPPTYVTGRMVLAFLKRDKRGYLSTSTLSDGALYPAFDEFPVFRSFIIEAVRLQQLAPGPHRDAARIDWLVRAASEPATRWHGAYGLTPDADSEHAFHDRRPQGPVSLTPAQKKQLALALVAQPAPDPSFSMILSLLADHRSKAVDELAVAAVDTLLARERPPRFLSRLMDATLARLHLALPQDARSVDAPRGARQDARRRAFWTKVRATLPFPPRALALPRASDVTGTEEMTPL